MKRTNPFPGMNPFLERHWLDVHTKLITYIADQIAEQLPDDLNARAEERVTLSDGEDEVQARADVAITKSADSWRVGIPPSWRPDAAENGHAVAATEPLIVIVDPELERWVQISDSNGRLITVIEVLSPWNKGDGVREYLTKRRTYLSGGVNVVEIDLLRGGRYILPVPLTEVPPGTRYVSCITRARQPGRIETYPSTLRDPLPKLSIPLRENEADIVLELQPLIDRCYRMGSYWNADHQNIPGPPLEDDESKWVSERMKE